MPTYYLYALPALFLVLYAQWRVTSTYRKFLRVPSASGMTGLQVVRYLLRSTGLGIQVETVPGELTDHYDPRHKVLRLSQGVAQSTSVGAIAVVAHELGHAMQDAQAFTLLRLRSGLVPMVNLTSRLGPIVFFVGLLLQFEPLSTIGLFFVAGAVVFSLLTLPLELDASRRAMQLLKQTGILTDEAAVRGVRQMLSAAALTYVAALAQSISALMYYLSLSSGRRRRRF